MQDSEDEIRYICYTVWLRSEEWEVSHRILKFVGRHFPQRFFIMDNILREINSLS